MDDDDIGKTPTKEHSVTAGALRQRKYAAKKKEANPEEFKEAERQKQKKHREQKKEEQQQQQQQRAMVPSQRGSGQAELISTGGPNSRGGTIIMADPSTAQDLLRIAIGGIGSAAPTINFSINNTSNTTSNTTNNNCTNNSNCTQNNNNNPTSAGTDAGHGGTEKVEELLKEHAAGLTAQWQDHAAGQKAQLDNHAADQSARLDEHAADQKLAVQTAVKSVAKPRSTPPSAFGNPFTTTKSSPHKDYSTEYTEDEKMGLSDMLKDAANNLKNCQDDLEDGAVFPPDFFMSLRELDEQCPELLHLLKLLNKNVIRTTPSCVVFLYACEIAGFEVHENASEVYSSMLSGVGLKYIFDITCRCKGSVEDDVALLVAASGDESAGGTIGMVLEIMARSADVDYFYIEGPVSEGTAGLPISPESIVQVNQMATHNKQWKLQKFRINRRQLEAFKIPTELQIEFAKCEQKVDEKWVALNGVQEKQGGNLTARFDKATESPMADEVKKPAAKTMPAPGPKAEEVKKQAKIAPGHAATDSPMAKEVKKPAAKATPAPGPMAKEVKKSAAEDTLAPGPMAEEVKKPATKGTLAPDKDVVAPEGLDSPADDNPERLDAPTNPGHAAKPPPAGSTQKSPPPASASGSGSTQMLPPPAAMSASGPTPKPPVVDIWKAAQEKAGLSTCGFCGAKEGFNESGNCKCCACPHIKWACSSVGTCEGKVLVDGHQMKCPKCGANRPKGYVPPSPNAYGGPTSAAAPPKPTTIGAGASITNQGFVFGGSTSTPASATSTTTGAGASMTSNGFQSGGAEETTTTGAGGTATSNEFEATTTASNEVEFGGATVVEPSTFGAGRPGDAIKSAGGGAMKSTRENQSDEASAPADNRFNDEQQDTAIIEEFVKSWKTGPYAKVFVYRLPNKRLRYKIMDNTAFDAAAPAPGGDKEYCGLCAKNCKKGQGPCNEHVVH